MKPEIIDNFLDNQTFTKLQKLIFSNTFPWFFSDHIATERETKGQFYFTHTLYENGKVISHLFSEFKPIFDKLNMKIHLRSKLNCYLRSDELQRHGKHIDQKNPCKGFILPFNTNNGFTEFNNFRIKTIANRGYKFDPTISHNSTNCTDAMIRVNMNVNYH